MTSAKARYDEQVKRDGQLTRLWTEGYTTAVIAKQLGFGHGTNVSHAAKRLGLPGRTRGGYTEQRRATLHATFAKREARDLAKLEAATLKPVGPIPTLFRCEVCGGKSPTPFHEAHIEQMWLDRVPAPVIARKLGTA